MASRPSKNIAVIGGGPAGLRAAEMAAAAGAAVTLFDAKPSVGRKFLVAGRGGLNLTKADPPEIFASRYLSDEPLERWSDLIQEFDPEALRAWAGELGVETFAASTGRVYPSALKAAPLLRRWVQRLRDLGVCFAMNHRWTGLGTGERWTAHFQTPDGERAETANAVILALGGGSWPDTGSDGKWTALLQTLGVIVAPLEPANCGWEVAWTPELIAAAEGQPVKNILARAGSVEARGELLITRYGLEGGAIYQLGPALRAIGEPVLSLDLKPSFSAEQLAAKLGPARENLHAIARERWRLSAAGAALLRFTNASPSSGPALAAAAKDCRIPLAAPRPIAEAISSAGGIRWSELDEGLMLRRLPGVFVAGEMIDWEAPTGGYLLHGCFATGTRAGHAAADYLKASRE